MGGTSAELIQGVLLRQLRASGRYRAVYYRRSNMKGDFALRGRLYDFKELSGPQLSARVTLELEMRDLNTAEQSGRSITRTTSQ